MQELRALRTKNLDEATFGEKLDIISYLGIKVYPTEDLTSMKVKCQLNLKQSDTQQFKDMAGGPQTNREREQPVECGIVPYALPLSITVTSRYLPVLGNF